MNPWLFWLFWFHVFKWELLELLCGVVCVCACVRMCACVWVLTYVEATPPQWNIFFIHLRPSNREDFSVSTLCSSQCVCVCVSNAWVSGGVCRCTPSVMQWQQFLRLIFSSPIFLELSVLWRCPQPPPPPHPHHHHPDPTSKMCLPHGGAVRLLSSEAARRRFSSATNWNRPSVKPSSHPSHLSTIVA